MNAFGTAFRVELFGESHGAMVGAVIDGCPPGIPLSEADFAADIARRKPGAAGTTPRREADEPRIVSGLFNGKTTGTPICVLFENADVKSGDYAAFADMPRPGHADFTGAVRYSGCNDPRGSGHFSARVTVGLVAAGVIAKKILKDTVVTSTLLEAGGSEDTASAIAAAMAEGDSVGGIVEVRVSGLAAGLGEPFFDSVESLVSHAVFSVPGIRGIEFGDGFAAARMRGSVHNDPIVDASGKTSKNGSGGVNGGITNGNDIVFRVAVKPTSSIAKQQETFNKANGKMDTLSSPGRHDACIALRAPVILEAAAACALADLVLISGQRNAHRA